MAVGTGRVTIPASFSILLLLFLQMARAAWLGLFVGATSATWQYSSDSNAVNGCGMVCNKNGPYVCLGNVASLSECEAACAALPGCDIMTWSSGSGNCWTRVSFSCVESRKVAVNYRCLTCRPMGCGIRRPTTVQLPAATTRRCRGALSHRLRGMARTSRPPSVGRSSASLTCAPPPW